MHLGADGCKLKVMRLFISVKEERFLASIMAILPPDNKKPPISRGFLPSDFVSKVTS